MFILPLACIYFRSPTWFTDDAGIGWAFRTEQLTFEVEGLNGKCPLHEGVTQDCIEYIRRCGDITDSNERGLHWFHIDGADRQNKVVSYFNVGSLNGIFIGL